MIAACKKREEWFNKEIQVKKKKEAALQKKLAAYDKPKEEAKETANIASKTKGGKKMTKKEIEAEAAKIKAEEEEKKRKEEEAAKGRIKAEEEERKRKEEEEKKAKEKKAPVKGKGKEEKVEEQT